jgi:hypothetical protein
MIIEIIKMIIMSVFIAGLFFFGYAINKLVRGSG